MPKQQPFQFLHQKQVKPAVRRSEERRTDFSEIHESYPIPESARQASRCSQCGIPMCQTYCPLGNNIPDWLQAATRSDWREAFELSAQTNMFPEVCGRVCPQDRLCEGHCVIERDFDSVTIGAIESKITEIAWEKKWIEPIRPERERAERIAIIGSGPGGLAAAAKLRSYGFLVDVFEKQSHAGGLLMFGIPHFKLDKSIVQRRIHWLEQSGIQIYTNCEIGIDHEFDDIRSEYNAIIIATGVYRAHELSFLQNRSPYIFRAFDFLKANNQVELGCPPLNTKYLTLENKTVAVIGGGDTAMDCVRTAIRRGAKNVYCVYRRDKKNMPGSNREVQYAEQEGVQFQFLKQPVDLRVEQEKLVLLLDQQKLSITDHQGRNRPISTNEKPMELDCDIIIEALGFQAEDTAALFKQNELEVNAKTGTIQVQPNSHQTNLAGVYAIGDIVRGASLVVWAIKDGQDCAKEIYQNLEAKKNVIDQKIH